MSQFPDLGCMRTPDGGRTFHSIPSSLLDQSTCCFVRRGERLGLLSTDRDGRAYVGMVECVKPEAAADPCWLAMDAIWTH